MSKLTYENEGLAVELEFDRYDGDRVQWKYRILGVSPLPSNLTFKVPEGQEYVEVVILHENADVQTPTYDMVGALRTLVSFLEAWSGARKWAFEESDNWNLSPDDLWECVGAYLPTWCDSAESDLNPEGEG